MHNHNATFADLSLFGQAVNHVQNHSHTTKMNYTAKLRIDCRKCDHIL